MNRWSTSSASALPVAARIAAALIGGFLLAAATLQSARAETVYAIRVRLHPDVAAPGVLPADQKARLEALAGTPLTLVGTTRTGGLELSLGQPRDAAELKPALKAMREDRSVLWAEATAPVGNAKPVRRHAMPARAAAGATSGIGAKLLVRLADGVAADWPTLLPRFTDLLGVAVAPDRQVGNVWVLRLMTPVDTVTLSRLAAQLQSDSAIQYADPVLRRYPRFVPNDPFYTQQWALWDTIGGIDVSSAWDLQLAAPAVSTTVAVVDTGILQHADLAGRLLPGYDFISDASLARDGDGRDPNPRDEGDWINDGDCGGFAAQPSSWHGTFVTGIIAADTNNGTGTSGIDLYARIVPVRALGECGGTDEDIFEGMLWASGVQIAGVPPNPNPAKVINMSLGGVGSCPNAVQDAIDDALAQGSVVVVAAGNESSDASDFAPASCSGVITVGATNRSGDITFYSNFGRRVDISAPGGDFGDGGVLSLSNDGQTLPGNDAYASEIGTSAAAPHVSGVASMMLARNPTMTPGRVLSILQGTSRDFPFGSICRQGNACGAGLLDAGLALASTIPGNLVPPAGASAVIEYYRSDLDHYYITADPNDSATIGSNPTGLYFFAWVDQASAPPGALPVCKFFGSSAQLINSFYFTADPAACQYIIAHGGTTWTLISPAVFWVLPTDALGHCGTGTVAVFRFDNNRQDFNQRHTIDLSVTRAMINRAWVPDGTGKNGAVFCSPI